MPISYLETGSKIYYFKRLQSRRGLEQGAEIFKVFAKVPILLNEEIASMAPTKKSAAPKRSKPVVSRRKKAAKPPARSARVTRPQRSKVRVTRAKATRLVRKAIDRSVTLFRWITGGVAALVLLVMVAVFRQPTVPQMVKAPVQEPTAKTAVVLPQYGILTDLFEQARSMSMGDRVAYWSERLWNNQDNFHAKLLEWPGLPIIRDTAPLIPPKFDCTTFVETVAALARSQAPQDFVPRLLEIRYKNGDPQYYARNHFPEADWIPNNTIAGVLRDVTFGLAGRSGVQAKVESKQIDKVSWLKREMSRGKADRALASVGWVGTIDVNVPYLALEDLDQALGSLPNGAIVNIVREKTPKQHVLISHQGFIVRDGERVYIRHSSPSGKIMNIPLKAYLERQQQKSDWRILGLNLNELQETPSLPISQRSQFQP